jgi:hypothetical protein
MPPNPYIPLDSLNREIWLPDIKAAKDHDAPIVCKLRHTYFSGNPSYEYISYIWGKEECGTHNELDEISFRVFKICEASKVPKESHNQLG